MVIKGLFRITTNEGGELTTYTVKNVIQWDRQHAINIEADPDLSVDEVIGHLESKAESGNWHSMVSMYRKLYEVVLAESTPEIAERVIGRVAEEGMFIP